MGGNNGQQYNNYHTQSNADGGGSDYQSGHEDKETSSLYFILFSTLLFAVLVMSKYLHEYPKINKYLSEAALILIVGLIVSFVIEAFLQFKESHQGDYSGEEERQAFQRLISFSPNIFFMALLPPILFNSGYQLRRELFLQHIYPIVMFAVIGTALSTVVCAMSLWGIQNLGLFADFNPSLLELFAFGSLISATDTVSVIAVLQNKRVDPHLFYVVFGESALNDAVALALFHSFADLLQANKAYSTEALVAFFPEFLIDACCSPMLGMFFGFAAALIFKSVDLRKKKFRMLELSLYLMLMYVPFIIAESIHLSGIVTIFFAGLSVRRYVAPNVSRVTEKAGSTIFQLVAFLSETCIFLELGLSIFGFSGSYNWHFIIFSLICCLFSRASAIYPLAIFHNIAVAREERKHRHHVSSENHNNPPAEFAYTAPATEADHSPLHSPQTYVPPYVPPTMYGHQFDMPDALQPPSTDQHVSGPQNGGQNNAPHPNSQRATGSVPEEQVAHPLHPNSHRDPAATSAQPEAYVLQVTDETNISTEVEKYYQALAQVNSTLSQHNSFDTEDTHGSITTATTHQSRKRRERRGRLMNNVKKERISWEMMHILWFAGLRGAVAYACVREFPNIHGNAEAFTAATIIIVFFTIVLMGGFTETLLGMLGIEMGVDLEEYMDIFRQEKELTGTFHDLERTFLYNVATCKPDLEHRTGSPSPIPGSQPPVFLGVDSNLFRSNEQDIENFTWSAFEMRCFPGFSYYADEDERQSALDELVETPHPNPSHSATMA